ncbi:histidine kinase [Actinoplanes sp. CA-054009]
MGARREWVADGLLGLALAAPVVANQSMRGSVAGCAAAVVVSVAATVLGRRRPLAGWLAVVLATIVDGNFAFGIPVHSYLVGLRTERVRPVAATFAVIAAAGTAFNLGVLRVGPAEWFELAMFLLVLGIFPWLVGRYQAQRGRLAAAGWERAARLESERRMVVLRERSRIAQEMHDSLGHELSLIALGAGALETSPDVPAERQATATRIRESAATATDQLREIIGLLRDPGEAAPLEPVDEPVESLVDKAARAGLPVTMTRIGDPAPAAVERTAYRVVREALTNASRHAPGAPITVEVTHTADKSVIEVINPAARRAERKSEAARKGETRKGETRKGEARKGEARKGEARNGEARNGEAWNGEAWNGEATLGEAWNGEAARGEAWNGKAARGEAWNGKAARGEAWNGEPSLGEAWKGEAAGTTGGTAGVGGLGLVGLRERVRLNGGTLTAGPHPDGGFRVKAEIPHRAAPAADEPVVEMRRRVRRSLAAAVLTPAALALVTAVAYYPFAANGSVMNQNAFERMPLGAARAELDLPERQAWVRDPEPGCEYYSDGNFPLADATFRLCFDGGRLVRKDHVE